jgi:hypothetical protein
MGDEQVRFPIQLAMTLSQLFANHGLQFFKINKTLTHVAVARPRYLDMEATLVSDGVKRIVDFINAHRKCNRRDLIEALAPTPMQAAPAQPTEGADPAAVAEPAGPTPEQMAVIADLHWLIHEGHVTEFHDGRLEVAPKPQPKPPAPEKKPREPRPAPGAAPAKTEPEPPAAEAPTAEAVAEVAPEPVAAEAAPAEPAPAPVAAEAAPAETTEPPPAQPPTA